MKRHIKNPLLMTAILFVMMVGSSFGQSSDAHISIGKQYFDIAETFKNLADFDKALQNCDKALGELQRIENPDAEARSLMTQAYYLKGYLLSIKGAPEETIKEALKMAHLTSPESKPPSEYADHPKMKSLLATAETDSQKDIEAAFDQAQKLFLEDEFCVAADIFARIAPVYKDPELATKYLEKSRSACKEKPEPKVANAGGTPRFGVFPVIYNDHLAHSADRSVTGRISSRQLFDSVKALSDKVEFIEVNRTDLERSMAQQGIACPEAFIIRWGRIYDYPCSDIGQGIANMVTELDIPDVGVNDLPDDIAGKLESIARELGLQYLLFFYIHNKAVGPSGQDISMDLMLYDADQTKKPVLRKSWINLTMRRVSQKRVEDTAELVAEYFKERGL